MVAGFRSAIFGLRQEKPDAVSTIKNVAATLANP